MLHPHAGEEATTGGSLEWHERRDRHWIAKGLGGYFELVPESEGYHAWWMQPNSAPIDLGGHGTLGGAIGASRRYADIGTPLAAEEGKVAGESAAEHAPGCPHSHPPEVATTPCPHPSHHHGAAAAVTTTALVAGEDRASLRWAEVWFEHVDDAKRFVRLIEKKNTEIVASQSGHIVTTNATEADIDRVLRSGGWKERHAKMDSVKRAAEAQTGGWLWHKSYESSEYTMYRSPAPWDTGWEYMIVTSGKGTYMLSYGRIGHKQLFIKPEGRYHGGRRAGFATLADAKKAAARHAAGMASGPREEARPKAARRRRAK